MSVDDVVELVKRHGSLHYANIKFGYIILLLSFIHLSFIGLSKNIYLKKWIRSGRSTTFKRLVSIPNTVFLGIWSLIIIGLLFYKFKVENISVFAKRFGRISYTLLPLDIFLSLKPNPLPNIYYLELVFLHKWISRLIILLAIFHSFAFLIIWIKKGTVEKLLRYANFLGVISAFLFTTIVLVSLKPIRRRFYKVFFTTHLIFAWITIFLIQFHARPGVTFYTLINIVLILTQIITKFWKSENVSIEKLSANNSNSTLEIIQLKNIWNDGSFNGFIPGSYLRLSYSKLNPLNYLLPSHPFTIASRPEEALIKLIIRKNSLILKTGEVHSIFGPFPSLSEVFFRTADNILLIAGGSGISFILGLYQELIKNSSVNVTLIWVLRNKEDLWILDHFNIKKLDIYITGSREEDDGNEDVNIDSIEENENLLGNESLYEDDFELESISDPFHDSNEVLSKPRRNIQYGRPTLANYASTVEQYDKANNWVVSCGSGSLNNSAKHWAESLKVRFHSESYEL